MKATPYEPPAQVCAEEARLQILESFEVLDTPPEAAFDRIAKLAAQICGTPSAAVTLVTRDRQWFKARVGVDFVETSRDVSFCSHAMLQPDVMVVEDALADARFAENPLVTAPPQIRFYAGAPVFVEGRFALGTLCVLDSRPRRLDEHQSEALQTLADQVAAQLTLRRSRRDARGDRVDLPGPTAVRSRARVAEAASPILESMLDAAVEIDAAGVIRSFNKAAEQMFGHLAQDAIGRDMANLLIPWEFRERHRLGLKRLAEGGSSPILGKRVEVQGLRSDGEEFPAELTVALIDGQPKRWMAFVRDLGEAKARERELAELVQDNATLLDSIGDGIFRIDKEGRITFVNPAASEILGWEADEMLGKHAHKLLHHSHEDGAPYPVEECPAYAALRGEVHHIRTEVFWRRDGTSFPVDYTSAPVRLQGEIVGAACCFADISEARQRERDLEDRMRWSDRIHLAVREDRFVLLGQPIYPCSDLGHPVRHELLIRLKDGERDSLLLPGEFLPEVERLGLIGQIDRWVISEALLEAKRRPVSMNLSARSISDPDISDLVIRSLQQEKVPRRNLTLEITETAALEDLEAAYRFVLRLTDIGCQIALDDFGTGYGTFAHLKELPVSDLKIDRSFVQHLPGRDEDERVVRSIVSVAGHFGMKTIAEGVETQAALDTVRQLGADLAQGFFLGKPAPLAATAPSSLQREC